MRRSTPGNHHSPARLPAPMPALSVTLILSVALMFGFGVTPAHHCKAAAPSSSPALDETPVIWAIKDAVTKVQQLQHHRIAATVVEKTSADIAPPGYKSAWLVTVKYWLDYVKPEDVPYLRGMRKYYSEVRGQAPKSWLDWAAAIMEQLAAEYAREIAFQQEARYKMTALATLNAAGEIIPSSVALSNVLPSGSVQTEQYIQDIPSDEEAEKEGYDYLRVKSGWADPQATEGQRADESATTGQSAAAGQPAPIVTRLWLPRERDKVFILAGTCVLVLSIVLVIINHNLRMRH